jgi:hypothetical protein
MLEVDSKLKESNKTLANEYYTFKVENSTTDSGTEVVLKFQDDTDFGHLNIHASKALKGLIGCLSLQIDAIGSIQTFCETIGRATKQADATVRVDSIHPLSLSQFLSLPRFCSDLLPELCFILIGS